MARNRGATDVETLLKIVLVLVVILLAVQLASQIIHDLFSILGPFSIVLQLAIAVLIVLWLIDRL